MKLSLVFFIVLSLTVGAIACSGSSVAQKESQSNVDGNPALTRVALEVPTIF